MLFFIYLWYNKNAIMLKGRTVVIYTVTFNPALDYYMDLPTLQEGLVNRTDRTDLQVGGKGINVSLILKNLGEPTVATGFVAGFVGKEVARRLEKAGVRTDFILLPEGNSRINVKLKGREITEINAPGPAIPPESVETLLQKVQMLNAEDTLVLAGSVPADLPQDIYCRLLAATPAGVRTVVDATGGLLRATLSYRPYLIKPNHHELGELFGRTLSTPDEVAECAAALQKEGARNVLVSMGSKGALLMDETGAAHFLAAPKGEAKGTVGAGDSMVAGFLHGAPYGPKEALRHGVAAGSATAFSETLATKEEICALLEKL